MRIIKPYPHPTPDTLSGHMLVERNSLLDNKSGGHKLVGINAFLSLVSISKSWEFIS